MRWVDEQKYAQSLRLKEDFRVKSMQLWPTKTCNAINKKIQGHAAMHQMKHIIPVLWFVRWVK